MNVSINYGAVIAAAALAFAIGGLWYSPIGFARAWMRETGLDEERLRQTNMARVFGLSFACCVVMALNLAAFIGEKGTLAFGLFAGAATGLGWVAMALGVIYLFERRSLRLWLINGGYQVLTLTAMGGVIGAWR
jgi:sterol desaturase/sphingolipid hydroxylase (fatty acid hydroxylase superfamily)